MEFFRILLLFLLMFFIMSSNTSASDLYSVEVTRVAQDLYKTPEGVAIKTRYCYEYAISEEAILEYNGVYSFDNKLIFLDTRTTCGIEKILR